MTFDGLDAAHSFSAGCITNSNPRREHLYVAHLDGESSCLHPSRHAGNETSADFPLSEIIADAAAHGSAAIVLAHNHPSGDARPSDAEKRVARRLATAVDALDCAVFDHLMFGGRDCSRLR